MAGRIAQMFREPLFQFLAVGVLVFLVFAPTTSSESMEDQRSVMVSRTDLDWLSAGWQKRWNRPPTPQERAGLVDALVREIVMSTEARVMGLHKNDTIIRRHLSQKLQFLVDDLVKAGSPTQAEIEAYFKEHRERYRTPDRMTMTHVYLNPDKRGDKTLDDAKKIAAQLSTQGEPRGVLKAGDAFMLQSYYPERTQVELAKLFGVGFAKSVFELEPGRWHVPVLSGYGTHIVYIHRLNQSHPPSLEEVVGRVRADWQGQKQEELNARYVENLLKQYKVEFERASDTSK